MFKKILIVFIIYLVIRFLLGIWRFRLVVKKSVQDMNRNDNQTGTPEGEIRIKPTKKSENPRLKDDDQYVDYEEID